MAGAIWVASALGLVGGVAISYAAGKAALPRILAGSADMRLMVRLALAGTLVALLPALLLALVIGATLGAAWARQIFEPYGLAAWGAPMLVALGVALVFAGVLLSGTAAGIALGKALLHYRQRRAQT